MNHPKIRTPHGKLMAVHNGTTLAYYRRLHNVADAAEDVLTFLSDGHSCLDCGFGPHRTDCAFVALRASLAALRRPA